MLPQSTSTETPWLDRIVIRHLVKADLPALESELGLSISRDVFTDIVWGAIRKKIEKLRDALQK